MMTSVARLTLFLLISFAHIGLSAFTETTKSGKDYVEPNSAGTWCYYPAAKSNLDVACVGKQAEFLSVMDAHLAQGVSISYYGANNQRLGGAEYPVKTTSGKVYSRTPHNPYPSVDGPGYGLLQVMGFERSAKNRVKKITKKS
jgi:hypothetical protein